MKEDHVDGQLFGSTHAIVADDTRKFVSAKVDNYKCVHGCQNWRFGSLRNPEGNWDHLVFCKHTAFYVSLEAASEMKLSWDVPLDGEE